ncbi:YopX family protein [Prevotella histicola]|uniref:YopX family protein n=1 Tax=Prevotella histicola TaxID=470565 RepID=UPI000689A830|nr:YopX family protein [Prevotella histicola]
MKREILFRGKDKATKKWVYGDYTHNEGLNTHYISRNVNNTSRKVWEVDPDIVGQYTGLKDKKGNKIFEGDILFQGQELLGVVCISKRYGVSILKKTTTWSLINFCLDSDFDAGVLSDIEVRGNICDNPELMK